MANRQVKREETQLESAELRILRDFQESDMAGQERSVFKWSLHSVSNVPGHELADVYTCNSHGEQLR